MASTESATRSTADATVPLWIDGKEQSRHTTFDVISPLDNNVCWRASSACVDDAVHAVTSAQNAFLSWSKSKPAYRAEILLKTARIMEEKVSELAEYMVTEMGAEMAVAQFFVLPLAIQMLKDIAGRTFSLAGTSPICQKEGQSCIMYRVPYGVTLGIVPWYVHVFFSSLGVCLQNSAEANIGTRPTSSVFALPQPLLQRAIPPY